MSVLSRRADGWPLCPQCGEDELADLANVSARDDGPLFCYRCAMVTVSGGEALFGAPPQHDQQEDGE